MMMMIMRGQFSARGETKLENKEFFIFLYARL